MSPTRQELVEEIFLAAAALKPGERAALVARRCGSDDGLRREVESLLAHHSEIAQTNGSGFLDSRVAPGKGLFTGIGATALKGDEPLLPPDRRLGQYTVKAMLGQGGMGVVYLAEQDRPKRTVALKVMRRGVGSERHVRRFEFEAEMLGKLHHPGIAQVYEAGTFNDPQSGTPHPYIAMELIRGKPLIHHAQHLALSTRQRLELVALVCDAVEHAHMCGVIHRDLKPANILVTDDGQPKILDFGVARAIDRDIAVTTMQTSVGQIIGTLPYMSPEQIAGDQNEVDTRSDVYALGVVLYELLTERLPYKLRGQSLPEAARLVRESPPTRLSTIDRTLRGDVDTIVSKALSKEKYRRYQSAAALAADLRAYLDGRPISARQDSALYVLSKQIQRYKGGVAAAAIFVIGVLAFAVYASIEKARADRAAIRLRQELTFSNIERGRLLGLSGNLAAAEALLWPEHLRNLDSHQTYYALWELYSNGRCAATLEPHAPRTDRLCLSSDGRLLATSGLEPALIIWDTQTYQRLAEVPGNGVSCRALTFAPAKGPAAGLLAVGNDKGRISLLEPATAREVECIRESGSAVVEMVFDTAGQKLLVSTRDGVLALFDIRPGASREATQRIAAPPRNPKRPIQTTSIASSPKGGEFVLGCSDERIRIVSSADLTALRDFANPDDALPHVAWSPDGALIACGGQHRLTRLLDSRTGDVVGILNAPNGTIGGVAFSPDGRSVFTIGWWYLHVWDVESHKQLRTFSLSSSGSDIAVSPDNKQVWTNLNLNARAWDLDPDAGCHRIASPPNPRTLARFTPGGGGELIVGDGDGSVSLLSNPAGTLITTLAKGPRRIRAIAISPSAPLAAAVGVDGLLFLCDLEKRSKLGEWPGFKMITNDGLNFTSDGSRMILSAADDSFKVLEVPSGKVLLTIPSDGDEALAAIFSPDDKLIATSTRRGAVCLYDARTGERLRECDRPAGTPWTIAFSPDGTRLFCGNWDRSINVWSVATGKMERRLEGHHGLVTALRFRPREDNILASSGADGRVLLWDVDLPQNTPILALEGFDGWEVWALDFDRSNHLLGTNSVGTTVIWDLRHFNRHIGGNMNAQIKAHRAELGAEFNEAAAREQERLLLSRGKKPQAPVTTPAPVTPQRP